MRGETELSCVLQVGLMENDGNQCGGTTATNTTDTAASCNPDVCVESDINQMVRARQYHSLSTRLP